MPRAFTKQILVPTSHLPERVRELNNDFRHLLPRFRDGKLDGEVFSKRRLASIPVDPDIVEEREREEKTGRGKVKVLENGEKKVQAAREHQGAEEEQSLRGTEKTRNEQDTRSKDRKRRPEGVAEGRKKKQPKAPVKNAKSRKKPNREASDA